MNSKVSEQKKVPSGLEPGVGKLTESVGTGITRRSFLWSGVSAFSLPVIGGCLSAPTSLLDSVGSARLTARPEVPTETPTIGLTELDISGGDGILYVPQNYSAENAYPLFIGLHGASGDADDWNRGFLEGAEQRGMVVLAPDSQDYTWDLITGTRTFGPDVEFIDEMLRYAFTRCHIDPERIALGGYSDGASYALSLGVGNGDLFSHLIAFSPGFRVPPDPVVGKPSVFVSHGLNDGVLSFSNTANNIVVGLRSEDYDVSFHEFDGGHEVPPEIATAALDWFLDVR